MKTKKSVIKKEEYIYMSQKQDPLKVYEEFQRILIEDLGFDRVREERSEYWTGLPLIKPTIVAEMDKDPYTKIIIRIAYRAKQPRKHLKRKEDTLLMEVAYEGSVESNYPEKSFFQRSAIYKAIINFVNKVIYGKEKKKYAEECEELVIALSDRLRELYKDVPAIGRSTRNYFRPTFRR